MSDEYRTPPDRASRGPERPPEPRLHPTNPATLVVLGLGAAAVAWIMVANYYGSIPVIPLLPSFTIFALAAFEAVLARTTKARIDRKPHTAPVDPLAVARYVVLAKASSPAASIFAGVYGGILVWLLVQRPQSTTINGDFLATGTGLVAALALVGAALWLERSCRVPKRPEDDKPPE